eukprot:IDg17523t1
MPRTACGTHVPAASYSAEIAAFARKFAGTYCAQERPRFMMRARRGARRRARVLCDVRAKITPLVIRANSAATVRSLCVRSLCVRSLSARAPCVHEAHYHIVRRIARVSTVARAPWRLFVCKIAVASWPRRSLCNGRAYSSCAL